MPSEQNLTPTSDRKIVLTVQQAFTYSLLLVTFGASIYTFYKALPKIDTLTEKVESLNNATTAIETKIDFIEKIKGLK